jgi:hypothetical protein
MPEPADGRTVQVARLHRLPGDAYTPAGTGGGRSARLTAVTDDHPHGSGLVEWIAMTVDCPEPDAMADFYIALCGGRVTRRLPGEASVDAGGRLINFRAVPGYRPPTWPSPEVPLHAHFEYVVQDPYVAAQHLLSLGASLATHQDPDDPDLVVMLDPAGHPFCLIRSSVAVRFDGA